MVGGYCEAWAPEPGKGFTDQAHPAGRGASGSKANFSAQRSFAASRPVIDLRSFHFAA